MKAEDYLNRSAVSHSRDMTYRLEYIRTNAVTIGRCDRPQQVTGRIHYAANGKDIGLITWGDPREVRAAWHRLCRINRARVTGRPYLHLINVMGDRERRVLGHPPAGLRR